MSVQRYNVSFEPELVARIDAVAGRRGRSAFLAAAAEGLLRRPAPPSTAHRWPDGRIPSPESLHESASAAERAQVDGSPGERIEVAKQVRRDTPKRSSLGFDPSRFNQATRLR